MRHALSDVVGALAGGQSTSHKVCHIAQAKAVLILECVTATADNAGITHTHLGKHILPHSPKCLPCYHAPISCCLQTADRQRSVDSVIFETFHTALALVCGWWVGGITDPLHVFWFTVHAEQCCAVQSG